MRVCVRYSKSPLAICFACGNVHVSVLLSQFVPPSPSPLEPEVLFFFGGGGGETCHVGCLKIKCI